MTTKCVKTALNLFESRHVSAVEVGLPALFLPLHKPALLIPPHFSERPTLAVDTFIDIVGQNWPGIAELRTPLQQTVIERGLSPRWPQLSQIARFSEKSYIFHMMKRCCSATLLSPPREAPPVLYRLSAGFPPI